MDDRRRPDTPCHRRCRSARGGCAARFVKDGKIVLNISYDATEHLNIGNEWLELDTRFAGTIHHVKAPIGAILGIYARETGEGMVFSEADLGPQPPPPKPPAAEEGRPRPAAEGRQVAP